MAGAGALRIRLLGGFSVWVGGQPVPAAAWRTRKVAALLKLLALAPGHQLHREQLMEALWPRSEPAAAVANLRYAVHALRRALAGRAAAAVGVGGERWVEPRGDLLCLTSERGLTVDAELFLRAAESARVAVDLAAFEHAGALYTGDLLPDDMGDEWAVTPRRRLRDRYLDLRQEQAARAEALGQPWAAVAALRAAIECEPALESAQARLMRLLATLGERGAAVLAYQQLTRALRAQLGAEPLATTRRLYADIVGGRAVPTGQTTLPGAPAPLFPLPRPVTSFVGRELELRRLMAYLPACRLMTVTGVGGSGKSRLALAAAQALVGRGAYAEGVCFVELAGIVDPALVPGAVAAAVGLHQPPGLPTAEHLARVLADRALLLVLDNAEHLLAAVADLATTLLSRCPRLNLLVTSRERLGVLGETVVPLPPLGLPPPAGAATALSPGELGAVESVRLFLDRARLVRPDFQLTADNAALVAELCRWLDGLPLAIELAAARAAAHPVETMVARLSARLELAADGRPGPPRHRTLRAALAWSHALLTPAEQALFARLAVFADGWSVDLAGQVCADNAGADTLDLLSRLAEQSLVSLDLDRGGAPRYRLLETVREYAAERLAARGETERLRQRHAEALAALAEAARRGYHGPEEARWLARLDAERANLRAAAAWHLDHAPAAAAVAFGQSLQYFWHLRDHAEGIRYLEAALARPGDVPPTRLANAQAVLGILLYARIDYAGARRQVERVLALVAERPGYAAELAVAHQLSGAIAFDTGNLAEARADFEAAIELYDTAGRAWDRAVQLTHLTRVLVKAGAPAAPARLAEALAAARALGGVHLNAYALLAHGELLAGQGDVEPAADRFKEALDLFRAMPHTYQVCRTLIVLGSLARASGRPDQARDYLLEAERLSHRYGIDLGVATSRLNLAYLALAEGSAAAAGECFAGVLGKDAGQGDARLVVAVLTGIATLALDTAPADAARLVGAAATLAPSMRPRIEFTDVPGVDERLHGLARELAARPELAPHLLAGRRLDVAAAVALGQRLARPPSAPAPR